MSIDSGLTVLLTIKDRQPFTFRWMEYANNTSFPFKVLIADGGKDPVVTKRLSNKSNFPNIDYEYILYPYDQTYREYFAKLADLTKKVETPYLVFVDDDDFLLPEGVRSCVNFLNSHPDYISCGGRISKFFIRPDSNATYGEEVEFILLPPANSIDASTALERVQNHFQSYNVTWYDVHRVEVLQTIFDKLCAYDPDDILLAERFMSYLTVARGKVKRVPDLMLLRQLNILGSSCADEKKLKGDYFDRMLLKTWSQDFDGFIDAITKAVAREGGLSSELIRDNVVKGYRRHIAPAIGKCLADEAGLSSEENLSWIRKRFSGLDYGNRAKPIIRNWFHKFQDLTGGKPRARPITRSSPFYSSTLPVANFLSSAREDLNK